MRAASPCCRRRSPAAELDALHKQGIRGLRLNIATAGDAPVETIKAKLTAAAKLCERHGWHVQMFVGADVIEPLAPLLRALPVDSVVRSFRPDRAGHGERRLARAARPAGERQDLGEDFRRLPHQRRSERCAHRSARPRALQGQPRAHRLGLGLAAHAAAHDPEAARSGIAVPGHRHARPARSAAALARGRRADRARAGDQSGEALRVSERIPDASKARARNHNPCCGVSIPGSPLRGAPE